MRMIAEYMTLPLKIYLHWGLRTKNKYNFY